MLTLLLSDDEAGLLRESLQQKQKELILELSHAHHAAFKARLRRDLELMERVLDKLSDQHVA